jgi:hypothetical protein
MDKNFKNLSVPSVGEDVGPQIPLKKAFERERYQLGEQFGKYHVTQQLYSGVYA